MSIQTAFRSAFEPLLGELGFCYRKKGFYRYDPESMLVHSVTMEIGTGKRDLTTYVSVGGFHDRLVISKEGSGLAGCWSDTVTEHPLYKEIMGGDNSRVIIGKTGTLNAVYDLGPYDDESALQQFIKQRDFAAKYVLPDALAVHDAQSLFEWNWKKLQPLYLKNPEPYLYTYPFLSELVLYEALQAGQTDAAMLTAERVLCSKENRYLSALHRDYPNEELTKECLSDF